MICHNRSYKRVYVHRFVFQCVYGYLPKFIDHADRNKTNNTPENLRPANKNLNGHNYDRKIKKLLRGVSKTQQSDRYYSRIRNNGKTEYLGCYETEEDAHAVYCKRAKEIYGDFAVTED
jgi:hypothetical protein